MKTQKLDPGTEKKLIASQKTEMTEHIIYGKLSESIKDSNNRDILKRISDDELKHHNLCKYYTCREVRPNRFKIWLYYIISRVFGVTFGLKLMERAEEKAHLAYKQMVQPIPDIQTVVEDEERHGRQLIDLIDDERLNYTSDLVRGLNVALVELTGALVGLTLAFKNNELILTTGLIIGVTMSLSLTSTEYLATKSGTGIKNPFKSAAYAGFANIFAVFLLLFPYILFDNIFVSLAVMMFDAIIIIFILSFYISVIKEESTKKTFIEMVAISLGIAALAFLIGYLAERFLDIHIA